MIPLYDVPVFNCVVYLRRADNQVHARVANLAGLECAARDERTAISTLVREFKEVVSQRHREGTLQLIDPPPEASEGEEIRLIPVHL